MKHLQSWFRTSLVARGREALSAQPDTITLSRLPGYRWRNPAAADRLAAPLREKGFIDRGIFEIQPRRGFKLGVMLNERDKVAAFMTEFPTGSITLELSVRYLDGTTTALVNSANNGVPRPPFFRVTFAAAASSGELYERVLRERPISGIKTITADNVITEYQVAYAKIMAYTKGRGLSADEVVEIAARARRPIPGIPAPQPPETQKRPTTKSSEPNIPSRIAGDSMRASAKFAGPASNF